MPQTGRLQQQKRWVLEAESPRSRHRQGWFLSREGGCAPGFPLVSGGWLVTWAFPEASPSLLSSSSYGGLPAHVGVQIFLSTRAPVIRFPTDRDSAPWVNEGFPGWETERARCTGDFLLRLKVRRNTGTCQKDAEQVHLRRMLLAKSGTI